MSDPEFLDSNVLIYAYDRAPSAKQRAAHSLVWRAFAGEILISTQVLTEFTTTFLHKVRPHASIEEVGNMLDALSPIRVLTVDQGMVRRAIDAHARYGIHFYDGMIVAAAERGGCSRIWSEDLNPGQTYFGITVENPFG